jgi:serine/threonine protein kinase
MSQSIIGKVIDNYEITGVLGKGGMGVVYKAKDMTLDRDVALKMMDANFARDEEFLKRFKAEAKALARLQNPNIVSVFALRETEIGSCLVMEYVEGNTLADQIRAHGAMPLNKCIPIFRQISNALDHAHQVGVIHRDIKPSNVMVTANNHVKVADFGLAKIQQVSTATVTMGTGGTLYYMSPEQIKGLANVDARGDIYSLGMTLYETVAGRVPFGNNATDYDIRQMIVEGKIPPPDKFLPMLSRELTQVIAKSIHKDPSKRYQAASEMSEALSAVPVPKDNAAQPKVVPVSFPTPRSKSKSLARQPMVLTIGVGVILIALFFALRPLLNAKPASLSIQSNPVGSKIYLDGKVLGLTPAKNLSITQEMIRVRLEKEGYLSKDTQLVLESGQNIALWLELLKLPSETDRSLQPTNDNVDSVRALTEGKKQPIVLAKNENPITSPSNASVTLAKLILHSVPAGSVSVDGGSTTQLSGGAITREVHSGERAIVFEHPRYGTKKVSVNLKASETKEVTCYFETRVSVSVSGESVWGTIIVDGSSLDDPAPTAFTLGPGRHRIEVTRNGYETMGGEQVVVVEPRLEQKEVRLAFQMKKK